MPGDLWQKFANLRLLLSYHDLPAGQKIALHGSGDRPVERMVLQRGDRVVSAAISYASWRAAMVKELNHLYHEHRALWERDFDYTGFEWVDFSDRKNSVISYLRKGRTNGCSASIISRPIFTANISSISLIFRQFGKSSIAMKSAMAVQAKTTPIPKSCATSGAKPTRSNFSSPLLRQ